MNKHNHTVLASLALCAVAFTQSAIAEEQVKSDSTIKSNPKPAGLTKPVNTTVPPAYGNATPTTKDLKVKNTPKSDKKTKDCKYPALIC